MAGQKKAKPPACDTLCLQQQEQVGEVRPEPRPHHFLLCVHTVDLHVGLSGSAIIRNAMGVSERRLQDLFFAAASKPRSIIFIDEC